MSLTKDEQRSGMIQVRRDNVILDIPEEQKDYYKGLGYNVLGVHGEVVEETVPTDLAALQRFYKDAKKEIADLKAQIKKLKAEAQAPKKTTYKKPEPVILEEPKEESAPPVTTSRRRKNK
jgi:hypothetical protein